MSSKDCFVIDWLLSSRNGENILDAALARRRRDAAAEIAISFGVTLSRFWDLIDDALEKETETTNSEFLSLVRPNTRNSAES